MVVQVIKRDGTFQEFNKAKIADAIYKAAVACGGSDRTQAEKLADQVVDIVNSMSFTTAPEVETIQNIVEKVLIENRHAKTAKAYILYREKRKGARETNALIGATIDLFDSYLQSSTWSVKENANMAHSVAGLNNFVRGNFTRHYWLNEIYPEEIREAHLSGALHLHDLDFFGSYCVGWDLKQLIELGFTGVPGKVSSRPAKHLRSFLGQVVNATFTLQGESAGAQAWSSFDTYCAPFVKMDNLTHAQVKQALQEFIFNMNVPTRVGFQCPFSNITLDIKAPKTLRDQPVIIANEIKDFTYGDCQAEMDMVNKAFCEVMLEGDADGRVFTFPIPTINITKETEWNTDVMNEIMKITCKYGIPYFANYVNSDLSPEDAMSMCCRLRLDTRELKKRGHGLFGSNPLTGSIGVVTINLPRIGYLSKSEDEFFARLTHLVNIAKTSLVIKRKIVEDQTVKGLYPYSRFYLKPVFERTGQYWANHFNTIGIIGMNECLLNYMETDITTKNGQEFSKKVMNFLRDRMSEFQEETGGMFNLEATPGEGVAPRFARIDKARYPGIITAGKDEVYYTNSTQLPVGFGDDIFKAVELQDELQSLYTGGTVLHFYLGEKIDDIETAKKVIQKIFNNSKMPYVSLTPTFSVCPNHGYIAGEHFECPHCKSQTEVWSRVVGYLRSVQNFNASKQEEYKERIKFKIKNEQLIG